MFFINEEKVCQRRHLLNLGRKESKLKSTFFTFFLHRNFDLFPSLHPSLPFIIKLRFILLFTVLYIALSLAVAFAFIHFYTSFSYSHIFQFSLSLIKCSFSACISMTAAVQIDDQGEVSDDADELPDGSPELPPGLRIMLVTR